jgi:hypothetical protein
LCRLIGDVFISPYDLYLVDRATGILGGFCKGTAQSDPTLEIETWRFADAEELLRDAFAEMPHPLPWIFTPSGAHYLLPTLAMSSIALGGFMALPYTEKARVSAQLKMCFVDGQRVSGFEHLDPEGLDPALWAALFDFETAITAPDAVDLTSMYVRGPIEMAMWMDRCLHRVGETRLVGLIEKDPLGAPAVARKFRKRYRRARNQLSKGGGLHGLFPKRG